MVGVWRERNVLAVECFAFCPGSLMRLLGLVVHQDSRAWP